MSTDQSAYQPDHTAITLNSQGRKIGFKDPADTTRERFYEIKNNVRDTADLEVTNQQILNILMDIYWLHTEHGTAEGEA